MAVRVGILTRAVAVRVGILTRAVAVRVGILTRAVAVRVGILTCLCSSPARSFQVEGPQFIENTIGRFLTGTSRHKNSPQQLSSDYIYDYVYNINIMTISLRHIYKTSGLGPDSRTCYDFRKSA